MKDYDVIDDADVAAIDPPMMLDADLLGESTPAMEELLDRPATFMAGSLYDQGDRRNTRDGDWKPTTFTWYEWMALEKIGLCNHPVAKGKQGPSLVFAEALGGARKDSAIKTMHAIGLDIDSGAALDDVIEKLIEAELFAIVYTSFSHGKSVLELKHDDIVRKLKLDDTPNRAQVQAYLREHHKDRYDPEFIDSIKITDARKQTKDGMRVVVETPALDKFRVILPLAEPVQLADLGTTLTQWKEAWEDAVCGVAVNMLDVNFDASSCDVNRLFYTPRHPADAADWYCAVIQGDPLSFDEIEPYSKNAYVKNRDDNDPFAKGTETGKDEIENYLAPSGQSLNRWHSKHKERFLITDVIETFCDDKIVKAGNERVGTVHIECPFEGEHSTTGGTATMCMNPTENSEGYWTMFCRHDACAGRNKLHFLQEMLEQEWFDEDVLDSDDFNLGAADEDIESDNDDVIESLSLSANQAKERVEVAGFEKGGKQGPIQEFMEALLKEDADIATQGYVTAALVTATGLGIRKIDAIWKLARDAQRTEKRNGGKIPVIGEWDDSEMVAYAEKKTAKAKDHNGDPKMYNRFGDYCVIKDGNIEMLSLAQFRARLNTETEWKNGKRGVLAPKEIAEQCFYQDGKTAPELTGVKKTAHFDAKWRRVFEPGYNAATGVYLDSDGLDVPSVSATPSEEEVREAIRLFIEEVFGDFPIGGRSRDELVEKVMAGEPVADFANLLAMVLQPFCRDGIDGPTPLYMLTKPTPGTGASLIVDLAATIATGDVAPPQPLPTKGEELEKTLLTLAVADEAICNFDNLNFTVSGGALASNLTARMVQGRLLSTNRLVKVPVRNLWVGTANNVEASTEILRRIVMIELDAHMAHPETRSGWRHADVMAWAKDNRGTLVWAALTLIQNWVAKGRPTEGVPVVNSYENWSRVLGGILKVAGINGFLGNQSRKLSYATTGSDNNVQTLMQYLWDTYPDGQLLRPGGTAKVRGYEGQTVESLKDVLNECGEEDGPMLIDGWGYSREYEKYMSTKGIGKMFRKAARAPWEIEGGEMTFEEHPDPKSTSQLFWIMRKRVV